MFKISSNYHLSGVDWFFIHVRRDNWRMDVKGRESLTGISFGWQTVSVFLLCVPSVRPFCFLPERDLCSHAETLIHPPFTARALDTPSVLEQE